MFCRKWYTYWPGLAEQWYEELPSIYSFDEISKWKQNIGFNETDLGFFYSHLYQFRFANEPLAGYRQINLEIKKGRAGFGHIILSQILVKTAHNVVITTNFDTLIEEAIYRYTQSRPIVVGHESIAKYAIPMPEQPIILKIHRDRFLAPFNLGEEISILQLEWEELLQEILKDYVPAVIG